MGYGPYHTTPHTNDTNVRNLMAMAKGMSVVTSLPLKVLICCQQYRVSSCDLYPLTYTVIAPVTPILNGGHGGGHVCGGQGPMTWTDNIYV